MTKRKIYLFYVYSHIKMENSQLEPPSVKLADEICKNLLDSYTIEELMETVRKNKDRNVYICTKRKNPKFIRILVDGESKHCYRCDDVLVIPIPKKFAVLEPDKLYFEMTLKANILLAVQGAREKDLHY